MNALERWLSAVARWMAYAGALALLVMTALVVISSVMRYFVGSPFRFTEELVALFYMSMVFLAIPLVTMNDTHVAVSVLPERARLEFGSLLRVGAALVIIIFCAWFTYEAFGWMDYSRRLHSRSEQADFVLWPWMAVIPATMAFVTLIALFRLLRPDRTRAARDADPLPLGDGL